MTRYACAAAPARDVMTPAPPPVLSGVCFSIIPAVAGEWPRGGLSRSGQDSGAGDTFSRFSMVGVFIGSKNLDPVALVDPVVVQSNHCVRHKKGHTLQARRGPIEACIIRIYQSCVRVVVYAFINLYYLLAVGNQTLPVSSHCASYRRSSTETGLCCHSTAHTIGPAKEKNLSGGCLRAADSIWAAATFHH